MEKKIDIRLERDPRYVAAQTRLTELRAEFNAADKECQDVISGLNSLGEINRNIVESEALAMLSGTPTNASASVTREGLLRSFEEKTHHVRVLRTAVDMQEAIVRELRAEVGQAIATDLLPQHKANVAAVVDAAIQLSAAMGIESALRTALFDNNVPDCGVLRPMTMPGVGLLRDNQSRISRFLLECHAYGFIKAADLPDVVLAQIPPPAKPAKSVLAESRNAGGWVGA